MKFVEYGLARFNSSPDPLQQDIIVIVVLGVIDISKSKPSHPIKPKIRKAEAAPKLAALRRNANVVRISDLTATWMFLPLFQTSSDLCRLQNSFMNI